MWNTLPIPPIEDIQGIACVSPISTVKCIFANGLPLDDFLVCADAKVKQNPSIDESPVFHVSQCPKVVSWERDTIQRMQESEEEHKVLILCWFTDWMDGFGPSRVKNNRGSVVAWTFTCSPRKDAVNSTDNTFLMAVGPKNSAGWSEVRHRVKNECHVLTDMTKPHMLHHGSLRIMVPVFFRQFAATADKVERPEMTGTIGSGSNLHREFGVVGKVQTPNCHTDRVKAHLDSI